MKNRSHILIVILACLLLPLNAYAMKHGDMSKMDHGDMKGMDHGDMKGMDHGDMKGMDHSSMNMDGETIPLGEVDVDGVKGSAYLLDVSEAMAKHGMKTTHHLMIKFTGVDDGEEIVKGRAAAKVKGADGKESKAFKMMKMDGAFGTDLTLDQQGPYQFNIGTKLSDKKKRIFSFTFEK